MPAETLLHLEGLRLDAENGLSHGPLDLSLNAGEGAVITCGDLDVLRRLMRCCLGEQAAEGGRAAWWTAHSPAAGGWEAYDFYRQIGCIDRHSQLLSNMSLTDNLRLLFTYALAEEKAAEREARQTLEALGLAGEEGLSTDSLPEPRRRLALYALALCGRPRLMLMERPHQFLGGDFQRVWGLIRRRAQSGLAYVVFDRSAAPYEADFTHRKQFGPE